MIEADMREGGRGGGGGGGREERMRTAYHSINK
jgi:hypothetical protein